MIETIQLAGFLIALAGTSFSISVCSAGLVILAIGLALRPRWSVPERGYLVVLIACLLVSFFISDYFSVSYRGFLKFLQGFLLLYAGVNLIRDEKKLATTVRAARPEIVLHLAAQPLVRASYRAPLETFASNVMGTAHLLDALRGLDSVRVAVMVTTDKV